MNRRALHRILLALVAAAALALLLVRLGDASRVDVAVPWSEPHVERDLDSIRQDTLRVLVLRDPLTWEQRPDTERGLEWELIAGFARALNVPVRALPVDHPDSLWMSLQDGRGDIIAAQLTPRADHARWVRFSRAYRSVRPVVASLHNRVASHGEPVLAPDLDTVLLATASPFRKPHYPLNGALCPKAASASDGPHTGDELLVALLVGHVHAAVVSDALAAYEVARTPVISFSDPIGPPVDMVFALRRNAPQLWTALENRLEQEERTGALRRMCAAYRPGRTKPPPGLRPERTIPIKGDSVSPYDWIFRSHAGKLTWDWHLLAALAYQESRFDSTRSSHKGATGIMQFMPGTAKGLGLDVKDGVDAHVAAAARYVNKLDTLWIRAVPDPSQRLRFVLASYNAGPGHVIDAQRLAEQVGLDPRRWEGNVEHAMLLLARPRWYMRPAMRNGQCNGAQVFHFVRDVLNLYAQLIRTLPDPATAPAGGDLGGAKAMPG
jgi:membrane-bound lytic murein transglycosylase F